MGTKTKVSGIDYDGEDGAGTDGKSSILDNITSANQLEALLSGSAVEAMALTRCLEGMREEAVRLGGDVQTVRPETIHVFLGDIEFELWSDAGIALFELHFPEVFRMWDSNPVPGLWFEPEDFIEEFCYWTDLFEFEGKKVVVVGMNPPDQGQPPPRTHRLRIFVRD
jgi:hypothetical protein